eukprot:GHVQ01013884.1.p1 GENE.GHVQ01013884.1~~GHVQ01013884.1.p1  ORF type:complete len:160 (+),score=34.01 GHVQ01013884.1:451-930(+)
MTEFGDSLEELEEKLLQYRQQLDAVEAALEEQPEEQALQKLQSDLHEVIALTEDLAKFQRQSVPQPTAALEEQQSAAASGERKINPFGCSSSSTVYIHASSPPINPFTIYVDCACSCHPSRLICTVPAFCVVLQKQLQAETPGWVGHARRCTKEKGTSG